MTVNCNKEIPNCISRYQKESASNKQGINDIYKNLHNNGYEFDVNKFYYRDDKICNENLFSEYGECKGTLFGRTKPRTYDEWKRDIEKTKAQELVRWTDHKIEDPIIQKSIQQKVINDDHVGGNLAATKDFIQNTKNILKHIEVVDDSSQYNIDSSSFTFI
ncbi:MAG: hypothetical protein PG981_000550 [Wolbachia endosymbiont of Ctenocephalides orientis wCori]|nr:MAG: hypothetical protein PG981_000550 [Wolbachia endosymbiont of Ctenocephalides orientis wCori]